MGLETSPLVDYKKDSEFMDFTHRNEKGRGNGKILRGGEWGSGKRRKDIKELSRGSETLT